MHSRQAEMRIKRSLRGNILAYNGSLLFLRPLLFSWRAGRKEANALSLPHLHAEAGPLCANWHRARNEFGDALAPTLQYRRRLLRKLHEPARTSQGRSLEWFLAEFIRNTQRAQQRANLRCARRRPRGNVLLYVLRCGCERKFVYAY